MRTGILVADSAIGDFIGDVEGRVQQGAVQQFLDTLPERALNLGLRIFLALLFFLLGVSLIRFVRKIVKKAMERTKAELGVVQFVDSFLKASLYTLLALLLASSFGLDAASVVALLGSAGVAIGLAIQGSLSNLAGGVLILALKPFKVGDYIRESYSGQEGSVKEIQIFYTKLLTPDNQTVILPNGNLANNSLVNITMQEVRRMDVSVGISHRADLRRAKEILQGILEEDEAALKDRERLVFVSELTSSSVVLGVRCWFRQADYWPGRWRITENCKLRLDEEGIVIAFNQLDVHLDGEVGLKNQIDKTGKN